MGWALDVRNRLNLGYQQIRDFSSRAAGLPWDLPVKEITNRSVQPQSLGWNFKIEPVLRQTWSSRMLGKRHFFAREAFLNLNPEISVEFFTDDEVLQYMKGNWADHPILEIFLSATFGPMKSDIFRYCITYDRGGFYFDISKGLSAPIRDLIDPSDQEFLSFEKNSFDCQCKKNHPLNVSRRVSNFGFGFSRQHSLLGHLIEQIVEEAPKFRGLNFSSPKEAILELTGPLALTHALIDHGSRNGLTPRVLEEDFLGTGIFALEGAEFRYWSRPSYYFSANKQILLPQS